MFISNYCIIIERYFLNCKINGFRHGVKNKKDYHKNGDKVFGELQ